MVLLFLFYINVYIMAIQVPTQSEYPKMYLIILNRARTSNINDLNGNNHYINAFRRSVTKSSDKAVQDLNITNAAMNASLKNRLEQILNEFDKLNQNLLESWRRKFDELKRTTTGTQSNETEASCSRLAPSSEYGNLKQIMIIFFLTLNKYARYGILWHHV
ncbi:hypothetical protein KSF78_0009471 [Schistosoma japonicum]|nr:hypothetical protein KSF78_0009471 [Schistosoma japonicum]